MGMLVIPQHGRSDDCRHLVNGWCYWCCERCNTDNHRCPGCGASVSHNDICAACAVLGGGLYSWEREAIRVATQAAVQESPDGHYMGLDLGDLFAAVETICNARAAAARLASQ